MPGRRLTALLLPLLAVAAVHSAAQAASPRDAIKELPKLTHSSYLKTIQNDGPGGRTYIDIYRGDWTVDWRPPAVDLGPDAKLKYAVYYSMLLQDQFDRIESKPNDLRQDRVRVQLNLDGMRWFKAGFTLEHGDTYKSSREWNAESPMSVNLDWNPPGLLPSLSYGFTSKSATRRVNGRQTSASEFEVAQLVANFKDSGGAFGQRCTYLNQDKRSRNYRPVGGTDENISRFSGDRQFPVGPLGNLVLGYEYEQNSRSDRGNPSTSTTISNRYSLSLGNNLPGLPIGYNYVYSNLQQEFPGGNHRNIARRAFKLEVTPPTPQGKSASLGFYDEIQDIDERSRRNSNSKQRITWSLRPNPRTNGNFSYEVLTDYDLIDSEITRRRHAFQGSMGYDIPGNRGSVSGNLSQWLESKPRGDARTTSDAINLSNNLRLGPRANITFNIAQQYSGSGSNLPGASIDTTRSSVRYRISWPNNLALDATYQQQLRVQSVDRKTVTENFGVKFDYRNDASWAYMFALNLGDNRDITQINPGARQYETQNVIEARVTYSF